MNEALTFASLGRDARTLSAQVIAESADIALLVWPDGDIAEGAVRDGDGMPALRGRRLRDMVRPEDGDALAAMVQEALRGARPDPVTVLHAGTPRPGAEIRYTAHLAGDGKNVLLVGSWLSPSPSMAEKLIEAEISRYSDETRRLTEARYRLLFQSTPECLIFVDPATRCIEEANANAALMLEAEESALVGTALAALFADEDSAQIDALFDGKAPATDATEIDARLAGSGKPVFLTCQHLRSVERARLVIRLSLGSNTRDVTHSEGEAQAVELLRRSSVPVLLSDRSGRAAWANRAFAALPGFETAPGRPVAEILGVSDLALQSALRHADLDRYVLTSLSALDPVSAWQCDGHLSIVAIPAERPLGYGFILHPLDGGAVPADTVPDHSAVSELVGQAPMRIIVRDSVEMLERTCIEAALTLTGNNRAAAANVLGLSRQSLYSKLHQHKIF